MAQASCFYSKYYRLFLFIKKNASLAAFNFTLSSTCTKKSDMDALTYTAARKNLAQTMESVCADHDPVIITRTGKPSVVMMSLEDY